MRLVRNFLLHNFLISSLLIGLLVSLLAGLTPAYAQSTNQPANTMLPPAGFAGALQADPAAQVLDVRTASEFRTQHLTDALNVRHNDPNFDQKTSALDASRPVYVYCLSGGRSAEAAANLRARGFTAYEMRGGLLAWNAANLPTVRAANAPAGMSRADFDKRLATDRLTLVDFGARWCPPCRKMAPLLQKVAQARADRVMLLALDVDQHPELARQLAVTELPALFLYRNGKMIWQQVGFMDEAALTQLIDRNTSK